MKEVQRMGQKLRGKIMKDTEIKDKTLKWICEHDAIIDNHPEVFPCTWISKDIHESVYKVRKCMKELELDGYVKRAREGGIDDYSCEIYCIHGYALTKKGMSINIIKMP